MRDRPLPEGTVTFVFTDIEGSTALFHELGDGFNAVLDDHNRLLREVWVAHGGVEVKTEGDAFFVAFADPVAAVESCADAQLVLARHRWTHGRPLKVRMGMHTGPAVVVDDDYVGIAVHEAARIASAANGGQVLVSDDTVERWRSSSPPGGPLGRAIGFHDLGPHGLKDFPRPRRLFQITHPELPAAFPPIRTLTARVHNLPALPTRLVGRGEELARVQDAILHKARLVTLTGAGGLGKSRLTIEAAWSLLSWFREGVWFVSLAPVSSGPDIEGAIAAAVGVQDEPGRSLREAVRDRLSQGPTLLVLDNFEHLLDAATLVSDLLADCPPLKVLASSRERLRLRGEHRIALEPLPLADAVELFAERAAAVDPDFALAPGNRPAVEALCERVDRIPLALELAAGRVADQSFEEVCAGLDRALDVLTEGERDLPTRQQTLRAAIAWSYGLLDAERQRVFRAVGAFAGRGSDAALAEVSGDVEAGVDELVETSLVHRSATGRWWMLQTIQEFAEEALGARPDELAATVEAHLRWFEKVGVEAASRITGPEQAAVMERLRADLDNLRRALQRAGGDRRLGLAASLARFWFRAGLWTEGREWLERSLAGRSDAAPPGAVAMVAMAAGLIAQRQGDAPEARAHLGIAVERARRAGDPALLAETLVQLAELERTAGATDDAAAHAEEAEAVAESAGSDRVVASAIQTQAAIAWFAGDVSGARELWERALAVVGRVGDVNAAIGLLGNLGVAARAAKDHVAAEGHHRHQLALARELGDPNGEAVALLNIASLQLERELTEDAEETFAAALALAEQLGASALIARAYLGLAVSGSDPERCLDLATRAADLFATLGDDEGAASAAEAKGLLEEKLSGR